MEQAFNVTWQHVANYIFYINILLLHRKFYINTLLSINYFTSIETEAPGKKKTKRKKDILYYLTPLLKGTVFFSFNNRPIPFRVLPSKQYRTVYSSCMVLNRVWEAKQNSQCIMSWEAFPVRICSLHSTWGFWIDPSPEQLRPTLQQENGTPVCERFQLQNSVFVLRNILHCELYLLYLPVQENSESMKAY